LLHKSDAKKSTKELRQIGILSIGHPVTQLPFVDAQAVLDLGRRQGTKFNRQFVRVNCFASKPEGTDTFSCTPMEIDQGRRDPKKRANAMRDIVEGEWPNTGDATDLSFDQAMKLREILCLRQIIQHLLQASLSFRQRGSREPPLMWVPSPARQLATSGDSNRVPKVALNLEEAELPS
jgi:hypothetical protein